MTLIKKKIRKVLNGNNVRISKYKNTFAKGYIQNWSGEAFVIKNVKNTVAWTSVISDLKGRETVGTFYKKELQKTNQTEFRVEKWWKEKAINYMLNGKATIILLTVGLIKKDIVQMSEYFPKPKSLEANVKVE